jgi:cytoskeletal protein CcmA (bactofilin family)
VVFSLQEVMVSIPKVNQHKREWWMLLAWFLTYLPTSTYSRWLIAFINVSTSLLAGRNLQEIAGGSTLGPGTYTADTAIDLIGTLFLDPQGESTATWTFIINGALTTAIDSKVIFTDNSIGQPANVLWVVKNGGAVALGARSYVVGEMDVAAAINIGAGGTVDGKIKSDGAVTLGAEAKVNGEITAGGAVTLGAEAEVNGKITAAAAITLGAGAHVIGCLLSTTDAAITFGDGATASCS